MNSGPTGPVPEPSSWAPLEPAGDEAILPPGIRLADEARPGRQCFVLIEGTATVEDVRVEGPAARLTLTGTASVPAREYDLKGIASLTSAPNAAPGSGFDLPFVVQGPWDDPLIFPDPESLIRRSPASAPLLDAVKDRKTRDAVRSVLERFTGGGQKAAAPDAAAPNAPADGAAKAN